MFLIVSTSEFCGCAGMLALAIKHAVGDHEEGGANLEKHHRLATFKGPKARNCEVKLVQRLYTGIAVVIHFSNTVQDTA